MTAWELLLRPTAEWYLDIGHGMAWRALQARPFTYTQSLGSLAGAEHELEFYTDAAAR